MIGSKVSGKGKDYPALIFDIDGTLYDSHTHTLSSLAMEQMKRLQSQGYPIGIATSRSVDEMRHLPSLFRTFPFDFMILDGGALILSPQGKIWKEDTMDRDALEALMRECEIQGILVRYSGPSGSYFASRPTAQNRALMNHFYLSSPAYRAYRNGPVYNLLLWTDRPGPKLQELLKPFRVVHYSGALELTSPEASKGSALAWLKAKGIVSRSVVFGDGENDIELFEQADVSVCPANGSHAALKKADLIVRAWNEEGIGLFLQSLE